MHATSWGRNRGGSWCTCAGRTSCRPCSTPTPIRSPAAAQFAFCHNGFFDRAEALRPSYEGRLAGGADSEVGWCFVQDRIDDGAEPVDVLREVDETFQGKVNLGYLDRTGTLAVYGRNLSNAMWRFTAGGADVVSTALHSDDDSVFNLIYPQSTDRRLVPAGTAVVLGETG